ncbi:xanthine dehydrogenase [Paenibacillus swuensis]|uniref:Xanthine dehydrogenase n=1 Tax=Paenibacillus swuensis TaxID=1178515 RepID=A0A172TLJ9_9BACL|nr:xanthine dehydrogenase subunit D [Paenibacillus swuensis]ANE47653.1 xanthine dehydrogenase [Paenibacillus swuensis]
MNILNKDSVGSRWRVRTDGQDKVTGNLKYLTDMSMEGMLHGRVLRSPHPHAWILSIDTKKARQYPGVIAVLTYKDVPGLNGYGIANPNQPVFCETRVRYVGDAVAAVAAETEEIAEFALTLIQVEYEQLPVIDDPEKSLDPASPLLHPEGNRLHSNAYVIGDVDAGFRKCKHIVEETYHTPRQMHTYMETEGGLFVPESNGRLTVYAPTQHGYMDRMQLARITTLQEDQIRVVSSPIGGSFGGKDELNVQPYGSLLALATRRPVKMHNSRWESVRAGLKRHPMRIAMKTGIDAQGHIMAHQVRVLADTGPYATLGAEVLNFTTEHVIGPYECENVDVNSVSVYTNNGMSGEFRGFGGNQAIFALEGQMDRLAERLGIDPWEFRGMNLKPEGSTGPYGHPIVPTDGARQVWTALSESPLWRNKTLSADDSSEPKLPWIHTGTGAAFVMHGAGLGIGIPDESAGRLTLTADGKIEAAFGFEEFGQGLLSTLEIMLIETLGCAPEDLILRIGDTDGAPHSGSSTASRATAMMWRSLQNMRGTFTEKLLTLAEEKLGIAASRLMTGENGVRLKSTNDLLLSYRKLATLCSEPIQCETHHHFPVTSAAQSGAHFLYTYASVVIQVEVNQLTGRVRVMNQFHSVAAGPVMNPQGYLGQIEGGSGMAVGFALTEEAVMREGHYMTKNLDTYLIPTIADLSGNIDVLPIEELPDGDIFGPRGIGEIGTIGVAPAIAAAVYDAVGKRVYSLPMDPVQLQANTPYSLGEEVETDDKPTMDRC